MSIRVVAILLYSAVISWAQGTQLTNNSARSVGNLAPSTDSGDQIPLAERSGVHPLVPLSEMERGNLALMPEYARHIEATERDLGQVKSKVDLVTGVAWALGGIFVAFGVLWRPIFRYAIEETAPRIITATSGYKDSAPRVGKGN